MAVMSKMLRAFFGILVSGQKFMFDNGLVPKDEFA